jgi:hypothetical protein
MVLLWFLVKEKEAAKKKAQKKKLKNHKDQIAKKR